MLVALATATSLPQPDPDEAAVSQALRELGADVELCAWDDPSVDWSRASIVVVRSTWNYVPRRLDFVAWAERVASVTRLENPAAVLRDNTDKAYLARFAAQGIPVVPTSFFERGSLPADAVLAIEQRGLRDVVVKPRVSAGSFATERFRGDDPGALAAFLAQQLAERDLMVQPYLGSIEHHGERSLVVIDGEITHAMRKAPRFMSGPIGVTGPVPVADDERALAERVLASVGERLLYARVDIVRGERDAPLLMELELTEPYLMFGYHPPALARYAAAIMTRAAGETNVVDRVGPLLA